MKGLPAGVNPSYAALNRIHDLYVTKLGFSNPYAQAAIKIKKMPMLINFFVQQRQSALQTPEQSYSAIEKTRNALAKQFRVS